MNQYWDSDTKIVPQRFQYSASRTSVNDFGPIGVTQIRLKFQLRQADDAGGATAGYVKKSACTSPIHCIGVDARNNQQVGAHRSIRRRFQASRPRPRRTRRNGRCVTYRCQIASELDKAGDLCGPVLGQDAAHTFGRRMIRHPDSDEDTTGTHGLLIFSRMFGRQT